MKSRTHLESELKYILNNTFVLPECYEIFKMEMKPVGRYILENVRTMKLRKAQFGTKEELN